MIARLAALVLLLGGLGGCGGRGDARLRVFAASSLRDAVAAVDGGPAYVFDGSAALLRQLRDGARADVLLTADAETMDAAVREGLAREPVAFARNRLAIVVAPGNPRGVRGLADLAGLRVALAGPSVPVGRYARAAFALAGVAVPRASEETSARAVLGKVALGEVDAGVVYLTDARSAAVATVPIPDAQNVDARYLAAAVRPSPEASAYLARLTSPAAARELAARGFLPP